MTTAELLDSARTIRKSTFVSVRDIQKSPGKAFKSFRILTNNGKPQGVYLPFEVWEDLQEDFEALRSPAFLEKIKKARASKSIPATEAWKTLGI